MTGQITKRQHQVPQFYIKLWVGTSSQVYLHDLQDRNVKPSGPKGILFGEFYYEEDPINPDNRIEDLLGKIETEMAPVLKDLNEITEKYPHYSQDKRLKKDIGTFLTPHNQRIIKEFSAFQYLRIPGAVEQKQYELQGGSLQKTDIDYGLNPGRFVETGFNLLKDRFMALKLIVNYSYDSLLLTSDWPCFDMKDSDDAPFLGEEIGHSQEVIACTTLGPKLRVIFYPSNFHNNSGSVQAPDLIVKSIPDSQVKNHNTLIIQQAIRYVISVKKEKYIFQVAAKRKRNKL